MKNVGVMSIGIKLPILKESDDVKTEVVKAVLNSTFIKSTTEFVDSNTTKSGYKAEEVKEYDLNNRDVIGITESLVARLTGNYVTVDEIASWIKNKFGEVKNIYVLNPIYSRNRFSMILKAFARAASSKIVITMPPYDEVGNPSGRNKFTGVDIEQYYFDVISKEECSTVFYKHDFRTFGLPFDKKDSLIIYCGLHDYKEIKQEFCPYDNFITLADIFNDKCEYGLLGSNKATEEKIKLFPNGVEAQKLVEDIQKMIFKKTGKNVEVMIYGDGCFKDPVGGIWEFADPVVSPAYTKGLEGRPNEIKIKAFADDKFKDLSKSELTKAIKEEIKSKDSNLVGNMASQGTTPRRYVDLLGSLMDLTSGSGDKGTPVVLIKNYFNNYSND
jgi:hypothetical protein